MTWWHCVKVTCWKVKVRQQRYRNPVISIAAEPLKEHGTKTCTSFEGHGFQGQAQKHVSGGGLPVYGSSIILLNCIVLNCTVVLYFTAQRLDLFAWCVRLSRPLVGFRTHFNHCTFISFNSFHFITIGKSKQTRVQLPVHKSL